MTNTVDPTHFVQALKDPTSVPDEIFGALLAKYPYAQSIVLAYTRKCFLEKKPLNDLNPLAYTAYPTWLYEYVTKPVEKTSPLTDELLASETVEESSLESAAETQDVIEIEVEEQPAADEQEVLGGVEEPIMLSERKTEHVSLYHDDLMPYSFRWWLYKTRLEYAETYQPFAAVRLPQPSAGQVDFQKVEEAILDQQIRENIFHLQRPEEKLSDRVKQRTVEFTPKRKTDEVIERFIQKEPQIKPPTPEALNTENKARKSAEDQSPLVSETLANIYIEQGMYPKAIDVFKKLILMNPEKKSYFATRIEEIEQKF